MNSRLGFVSWALLGAVTVGCSKVHVEPWQETGGAGGGSVVGTGGTGGSGGSGGEAPACSPLGGPLELGCIERNNTRTGVATAIDDVQYLHFLSVTKTAAYEGMMCAYGALSFGGASIDAGSAGSCFRFTTDSLFQSPEFTLIPGAATVFATRGRRALVRDWATAFDGPPSYLGTLSLLEEDGTIAWSRPKYDGTAVDNLGAFEESLVLENGDVAVTLILGTTPPGTVDFGDGFTFADNGKGDTAYLARFDGATGKTIAAWALPAGRGASDARPLQGSDGRLTALVASSSDGKASSQWYALEDETAVELARTDDLSVTDTPLIDNRGDLWVAGGPFGIRRIGRDGSCHHVAEFGNAAQFIAHDLALLPSGNIVALLNAWPGAPDVDGCVLSDLGVEGEAFAAEITLEGDWIRVARITSELPEGSLLHAVSEDDLVIYSLWDDEQRIERFDWSEMAF